MGLIPGQGTYKKQPVNAQKSGRNKKLVFLSLPFSWSLSPCNKINKHNKYNEENITKNKKINEKGALQILGLDVYKGNTFNRNRQLENLVSYNCKKLSSWNNDQEKLRQIIINYIGFMYNINNIGQ